MNRSVSSHVCFVALLALAGCRVGPDYRAPAMPAPPAYKEAIAQPSAVPSPSPQNWWTIFHDAALDELESKAVDTNPDVRIALARVDQADAARRSIRSYELPSIAANPAAGRTRESQNRPNNGNTNGKAATYNDFQLPLGLSYEVDAWGRIRRMVESAAATQQATQDDLDFVRLSIAASIATAYYNLREADAEAAIVQDTIADLQRGYDITERQFQRGIISKLAVEQAKTLLDQANGRIEALHRQRAQSEHILAALIGVPASTFSLAVAAMPSAPPNIPAGIPAALLNRRPDIAAAERRAAAASAQIGVAKAAYMPQLSLTGVAGYESTSGPALLDWQSAIASLVASAAAPIFTNGRLRANVDQAQAGYRVAVTTYERSVLNGYQEVEDQLAASHYLARQYDSATNAVEDATRSEQIANNRYQAGLVSYLDVVFAQQVRLDNQQAMVQLQGQRLSASIALIRALGGGW